ncbi:MAG: hypothetical protein J5879_05410 [Clostridia bacterium]|nr:hypothetical protein [Clostridia bacterium]
MSVKYSLNDVLIQAGVEDYRQIEKDAWEPSDKHLRAMEKIYKKEKNGKVSPLVKALYAAAAVALLIGLSMTIRPVRDAVSSFFGGGPDAPGSETVITPKTEAPETTEFQTETQPETETETEAPEPKTDKDKIDAIVDDIINNGYSEKKIGLIKEYGVFAFRYCADEYFGGGSTAKQKAVYSIVCSKFIAPEVEEYDPGKVFIKIADGVRGIFGSISDHNYASYSVWLENYRTVMTKKAYPDNREEFRKSLPYTYLLLDTFEFSYYRAGSPDTPPEEYRPIAKTIGENLAYLKVHGISSYKKDFSMPYYRSVEGDTKTYLDLYAKSKDTAERAAISVIVAGAILYYDGEDQSQVMKPPLDTFFDTKTYAYLQKMSEENIRSSGSADDLAGYAGWLDEFMPMLKETAKNVTQGYMKEYMEYSFCLLDHTGFDGYYACGEREKLAEEAINEYLYLLRCLRYGNTNGDDRDECYIANPDALSDRPYNAALEEKIGSYIDFSIYTADETVYAVNKGDLRTRDGWEKRLRGVLDDPDIAPSLIKENENFLTVGGVVYTRVGPYYTSYVMILPGSVRIVSQNEDEVTAEAYVLFTKDRLIKDTFTVRYTDGGVKVVGDGTYYDKFEY